MKLPAILTALLGAAACAPMYSEAEVVYASPDSYGDYQGAPDLIYTAPGVQVAAGWDQPMFFVDNSWWWWNDGAWMMWGGNQWGWGRPPMALTGIRDPWRYRSWGAPGMVRDHRWSGRGGQVRGTRGWSPGSVTPTRGRGSPTYGGRSGGARSSGTYRGGGSTGRSTIRDHRRR